MKKKKEWVLPNKKRNVRGRAWRTRTVDEGEKKGVRMGSTLLYCCARTSTLHAHTHGPPQSAPLPFNLINFSLGVEGGWCMFSGAPACNRVSFRVIIWEAGPWTHHAWEISARLPLYAPLPAGGVAVRPPSRALIGPPPKPLISDLLPPTPDPMRLHNFDASTSSFRSRQNSVGDSVTEFE